MTETQIFSIFKFVNQQHRFRKKELILYLTNTTTSFHPSVEQNGQLIGRLGWTMLLSFSDMSLTDAQMSMCDWDHLA